MSKIIKVIDNETIEIADYRNPEAIFKSSQNPPTLQNTRDEIEHLEWYCIFKDTINPFQMYAENHKLRSIIKEVREKVDNFDVFKEFTFPLMKRDEEQQVKSSIDYEWRKSIKEPILEILEKENKE